MAELNGATEQSTPILSYNHFPPGVEETLTSPYVMLGHPNLNLTPDEKRVFGQLFAAADTDNIGVVTGEVAVKFFERTKLAPTTLGEVWTMPSGLGYATSC